MAAQAEEQVISDIMGKSDSSDMITDEHGGAELEEQEENEPSDEQIPEDENTDEPEGDIEDTQGDDDPEAEAEQEEGGISDAQYERASALGIDRAQLESFGNNAGIFLDTLEAREQSRAEVKPDEPEGTPEPEPEKDEPFSLGLSDEQKEYLDSDLVEVLEGSIGGVVKKLNEQLKPLTGLMQRIQDASANQEVAQETEWFDKQVTGLGKDDIFGKGTIAEIKAGSAEFDARQNLYRDMQALVKAGYKREDAFEKAKRAALFDSSSGETEKQLADKAARRKKLHVQEPATRKKTDTVDPEKAEEAEIAQILGLKGNG